MILHSTHGKLFALYGQLALYWSCTIVRLVSATIGLSCSIFQHSRFDLDVVLNYFDPSVYD